MGKLDEVKKFLERSRTTNDLITREEYETAIMLAIECADEPTKRTRRKFDPAENIFIYLVLLVVAMAGLLWSILYTFSVI